MSGEDTPKDATKPAEQPAPVVAAPADPATKAREGELARAKLDADIAEQHKRLAESNKASCDSDGQSGLMLNPAQRERIVEEMAFRILGDSYALVPLLGRRHAIRIARDPAPRNYALRALQYCERSAWVETPPLLVNLLQPHAHRCVLRRRAHRSARHDAPDLPCRWCAVGHLPGRSRVAVPERDVSRRAIRQFADPLREPVVATPTSPSPARVLVVNGPPGSGKTFTVDYVRYLAMVNGNIHGVAYVDAAKQVAARFGPADLVLSLATQIDPRAGGVPVPGTQRADRWILEAPGGPRRGTTAPRARRQGRASWRRAAGRQHHPASVRTCEEGRSATTTCMTPSNA